MPDLLTTQDFTDIRNAVNDVADTFFKQPISYKVDKDTATRFQRDIKTARVFTTVTLNALVVWEKTGNNSENKQSQTGAYDIYRGYCLVKYDDAATLGIIDSDKNVLVNPPQDKLTIGTVDYYVIGVNLIGQLGAKECLLKIHISTKQNDENGK